MDPQIRESEEPKTASAGFPYLKAGAWLAALGVISAGMWYFYNSSLQSVSSQVGSLSVSHQTALAEKDAQITRLQSEQSRLADQLKKAFATNKRLIHERDELNNKVKAFQGSINISKISPLAGASLPDGAIGVQPITIRPLAPAPGADTGGFSLKDGGKTLIQRKDGFYQLNKLPGAYQAALGPNGLKVSGMPRLLSRLAPPADGLFKIQEPDRVVLKTSRPTFKWTAAAEAGGKYQVVILGEDGKEAMKSPWLESLTWTPDNPLPRGKVYRWKMMILSGEGQEPKPRVEGESNAFAVVGESEMAKLEKAEKESGDSHLLLAFANAEAGLIDPAVQHLQALKKANPGSPIPDALLMQIRRAGS